MDENKQIGPGSEELARLYLEHGLTCVEIGKRVGLSHGAVWERLKRQGVPRRSAGRVAGVSHSSISLRLPVATIDKLGELARAQGSSRARVVRGLIDVAAQCDNGQEDARHTEAILSSQDFALKLRELEAE